MAKLSLDDRLNQIEDKISEKSFRENKGLGNEVGYYIFDYDPREELYVRNHIAYLKDRINNGNKDFRIVEFDLFHLMVEILQEEGYLEAFFDLEKENGFFEMADSLIETLGLDETNELQNTAESLEIQFALGQSSNTHDLLIAQTKASVALQYTVAVRNKMLDAYKEIMQMQI